MYLRSVEEQLLVAVAPVLQQRLAEDRYSKLKMITPLGANVCF